MLLLLHRLAVSIEGGAVTLDGADGDDAVEEGVELGVGGVGVVVQGVGDESAGAGASGGCGGRVGRVVSGVLLLGRRWFVRW